MERWEEFAGGKPRAPRFPLKLRLRFRTLDDEVWRYGRGINISRSGLLFESRQVLHPHSEVEVSFVIPQQAAGKPGATVVCRGRVVRQAATTRHQAPTAVAATIETYNLRREPRP
jgi:hypothetical protein